MKKLLLPLLITFSSVLHSNSQSAISTFNVDDEGWKVAGDATSANPQYQATGGNPGGYITATDLVTGGVWYWLAPAKFLGNKSSAYDGTLQFDLRQSSLNSQFDAVDIYLTGSGITLVLDLANNPGTSWTHYDVPLNTSADWRVSTLTGTVATQAQIQAALSNITNFRIRGEYITGADQGDLDNVIFPGTPLPIKLVEFKTVLQSGKAVLSWIAAGEENASHFVIEHSTNGFNFSALGIVNSKNHPLQSAYAFVHDNVTSGQHYYRLKMFEKDGSFTLSPVNKISVTLNVVLQVWPNPANKLMRFRGLPPGQVFDVQIKNQNGQTLRFIRGLNNASQIDVSELPAGLYYVILLSEGNKYSLKMVKQ